MVATIVTLMQALALFSYLEDGEVPRRVALHCPMHSDGLCLVKIFGE